MAATTIGSTVAANAASNTPTSALACPAVASAAAAAAFNQPAYGAAAAAISAAAAPCHDPAAKPAVTDPKEVAADPSSAANPSHAAAAVSKGPDPAPLCSSTELISGGST
ncbi:PE family protein [Mycobacterium basiliense]